MTVALSTPVTGAAQTGLTSPTYTLTTDVAPGANGKQYAVTALGGTQTGVRTHAVSDPFTITFVRPVQFRVLPQANAITGGRSSVPKNTYKLIIRKGVLPYANANSAIMLTTVTMDVPAGSDTYDAANVRAALSLAIGALSQLSAGMGDTLVSGVM